MQPTGFNTSLVQAPPSTDACLAKGARLGRSSQECCCRLALKGGGRPLGTQMHKLRPAILVPFTAAWEPSARLLLQLQGLGPLRHLCPPHSKGLQAHKGSQSRLLVTHSFQGSMPFSLQIPSIPRGSGNLLPEDSLVLAHHL